MENISTDRELATPNYIGMLSHLNIHSIDGAIIFKLQEKQNKKNNIGISASIEF